MSRSSKLLILLVGLVALRPASIQHPAAIGGNKPCPLETRAVKSPNQPQPPAFNQTYTIINAFDHDPGAFTQGLVFHDGFLYEGTGLHGESGLRKVELETGRVLKAISLPARFFGEGITSAGDKIVQLTLNSNIGFVYDERFNLLKTFAYPTEGWGITYDGKRLIVSDGTSILYFWDLSTFEEIGRIQVFDMDGPVHRLNELEYIRGEVWANVWPTDRIARIDPYTGQVKGWIDLTGILNGEDFHSDVLNGIAYDPEEDRIFVTGKLWPKLFEIRLTALKQ
ncbi:MAG: glutaminyl-peptide cyclotransferase [Desulfobacteraceae bacterium]|nr:MAG: glutaminyl-peptide cyclotransferase [Desulfobacteraceae bacterium]